MAIAEVGSGSQRASTTAGNVDSTTLAFPANVTSGNLLLVAGSCWQTGAGNSSIAVTDTRSTSYTVLMKAGFASDAGQIVPYIAYGVAPTSGACTVTVDPSGTGNYVSVVVDEFSGVHATPLDVDGGQSTGTSTAPADGLTTASASTLLVALAVTNWVNTVTFTDPGGATRLATHDNLVSSSPPYDLVILAGGAAGAKTVTYGLANSMPWLVQTLALAAASTASSIDASISAGVMTVTVVDGSPNTHNWVGVFPHGATPGAGTLLNWVYLNDTQTPPGTPLTSATLVTLPVPTVDVDVLLLENDTYTTVLASDVVLLGPAPTITITTPTSSPTYSTGVAALTLAGTATDATSVTWRTNRPGDVATTVTLGTAVLVLPQSVVAAAGFHVWPDSQQAVFDNGDGTFTTWASSGGDANGIGRAIGTMIHPMNTSTHWLDMSTFGLQPGEGTPIYAAPGPIYKDPGTGRLIGFAHFEMTPPSGYPLHIYSWFHLFTSTNNGDTWADCGEIVAPYMSGPDFLQWKIDHSIPDDQSFSALSEDFQFVIFGSYFYAYYHYFDVYPPVPNIGVTNGRVGLARCLISDVVAAAVAGTAPLFKKWTADGFWSANGIRGQGDFLPTLGAGVGPEVWRPQFTPVYNSYLGYYCGILKQYTDGTIANTTLLYTESADGINWTVPQDLGTTAYDYNSIVPAGPTRTVGRTFTRWFQDIPGVQGIHSQPVSLEKTNGTATGTATWTADVTLAPGDTVFTVTATNAAGQAEDAITVTFLSQSVEQKRGAFRGAWRGEFVGA